MKSKRGEAIMMASGMFVRKADYDALRAERDGLKAIVRTDEQEIETLRKWQDLAFELLTEIRKWAAPGAITDLEAVGALRALLSDKSRGAKKNETTTVVTPGHVEWPWYLTLAERQAVARASRPEFFDVNLLTVILDEKNLRTNAKAAVVRAR